jgi:hypothetical protein
MPMLNKARPSSSVKIVSFDVRRQNSKEEYFYILMFNFLNLLEILMSFLFLKFEKKILYIA